MYIFLEAFVLFVWPTSLVGLMVILFLRFCKADYRRYHPFLDLIKLQKSERVYWPKDSVHRSWILYTIHILIMLIRVITPLQYIKVFYKKRKETDKDCGGYLPSWIKELYIFIWILYDSFILIRFEYIDDKFVVPVIYILVFQLVQVIYSCLYYNFFRSAFYKDVKVHNFHRSIVLILINYFEICIIYGVFYMNSISKNQFYVPNEDFKGSIVSFYYSMVTISTLGYGDIYPNHPFSRILVISEVFIGMIILVIALSRIVGYLKNSGDMVDDTK